MLVIVGLVIAFVLVAIYAKPKIRACRWREDRTVSMPGQTAFHCVGCGARTFTSNGKPPLDCLKDRSAM